MTPEMKILQEHIMTIENDSGLHRCLFFGKPGSSDYHFRLITWPGHLAISGDMGDFTFSRIDDMFDFFRGGRITPRYWGEKLVSTSCFGGHDKFSWDKFAEEFREHMLKILPEGIDRGAAEGRIGEALSWVEPDEFGAVELVRKWNTDNEDWEHDWHGLPDGKAPSYHFLWCLRAIVWGIEQYDKAMASRVVDPDAATLELRPEVIKALSQAACWQPVEKAPDCEHILILVDSQIVGVGSTYRGDWWASMPNGEVCELEAPPTHWMPLPKVPV